MAIEIPKRKNVKARAIAAEHPEMTPAEIAAKVGMRRGSAMRALNADTIGRDTPKSKRQGGDDGTKS